MQSACVDRTQPQALVIGEHASVLNHFDAGGDELARDGVVAASRHR